MSLSSTSSLPKPKNWQDFERSACVLFECILDDPNIQMNGRIGQPQNGVDIYGMRSSNNFNVGIQCKKKYDEKVTEKELREEIEKAKNFKPKLVEYFMVTTAPRDQKVQETARLITEELLHSSHPIRVYVWGWDDIEEHASSHERAWKAFDPTWNPFAEKTSFEVQEFKKEITTEMQEFRKEITTLLSNNKSDTLPRDINTEDNEDTKRHGQITEFQRLIDEGFVAPAIEKLYKLKNEEWHKASSSERYRLLVSIASAKLKMGEQSEAGEYLLNAYGEYPEGKNAQKNRATGYLLKNQYEDAKKVALDMLEDDKNDEFASGILIRASIYDNTCFDPLYYVPEALHETEEVLIAYAHFHRQRESSYWIETAKKGFKKYPDSRFLKLLFAEAVLDEFIRTENDAIAGGNFKNISIEEFNEIVDILYKEVKDALDKDFVVIPSVAHNAALALRLLDNNLKAKEILDGSIKQFPEDENLRIQRALIALSENKPEEVPELLIENSSNPETMALKSIALFKIGNEEKALSLIEDIDENLLTEFLKVELLAIRLKNYIQIGQKNKAVDIINWFLDSLPNNLALRILQLKIFLMLDDFEEANNSFVKALELVNEETTLQYRLELSYEARKLKRNDDIIILLKGRVATDRDNEGLFLLIVASINSRNWVTADEVINLAKSSIRSMSWFQRAEAILALNTGDPLSGDKITKYLKQCPNDLEMILAKIRICQISGRESEITSYLQSIDISKISSKPEHCIRLAALICHYSDIALGLEYGYSILMNNWKIPQAHLAYHSFIMMSKGVESILFSPEIVEEDSVVCLKTDTGEKCYRIEKEIRVYFEEERLNPDDDLALYLKGKKKGDIFEFGKRIGAEPVEILWIKSKYLHALHESMEEFNQRFPRADGLMRFKINSSTSDPLEDIQEVIKNVAETNIKILNEYRTKGFPLSFIASLVGKDPIEAWAGLPSVNIDFQVCRGFFVERENAFDKLQKHNQKGCVIDAITLSTIYRLGVEEAVTAICGPIYTPQSVIDLLVFKMEEAKANIEREQGFLAWDDEKLVMLEYSEGDLRKIAADRQKIVTWARNLIKVASSMPKNELSIEVRKMLDKVGFNICAPAIAAEGNELILLSEDMGYRAWAEEYFNVYSTWLQPVLIMAREAGYLTDDEYCESVNSLALSGHTYISLHPSCLMHQAHKNNFCVNKDLSRLLEIIGGPLADIYANIGVIGVFFDMLWEECTDELKVKKIISKTYSAFIKGRNEDLREIIGVFLTYIKSNKRVMKQHTLNWLIGQSIGMPFFNELLIIKKEL